MTVYLMLIQALMLGAIFVHSACTLSKNHFKGWLNPLWLSHVCFVGYALYDGFSLLYRPYDFNLPLVVLEAGVLLHLIADYVRYRKETLAEKTAEILGD